MTDNNLKQLDQEVRVTTELKTKEMKTMGKQESIKDEKEIVENKKLNIKLKKKEKSGFGKVAILGILSFLFTALAIYFLMALPNKAEEIKARRTQSLIYQISEQDEVLLNKKFKETESDRNKLLESFPTETTLLNFIKMVEALKTGEVTILKFSIDSDRPTKIGQGSSFLPVSLIIEGEEDKVDLALEKIIDSVYFVKMVNFNKEYDSKSERVIAQTQFHLYVADEF